jgi:DNA-binding protein H-NS
MCTHKPQLVMENSMSKSLIVATILLSSLSTATYAQQSSICSNPLQRVCEDTAVENAKRTVEIKRLRTEIANEASKNAAPRIEEMKKKVSKIHFIKRAIQSYKIRNQEIMNSAKKRIGGLEEAVTNKENIARLKGLMKQAIDESQFDLVTKVKMKSTMDSITIGNFGDFIERTNLDDNILAQLMSNACGSDGMVENAFATTLGNERYVLICPGFLISASQTKNPTERMNSILHAISHEMGHHIDNSQLGNEVYKPYLSCLANNYVDQFKRTEDDAKFCKKNEKDPAACNMKVTVSHAGELVADAWGLKVLNIHSRTNALSFAETDSFLTENWTKLCGTGDEGIHPTGDFRIGILLGNDPGINDYMSCGNAPKVRPSCTLEGEVRI